jgi:hypothetical protein
VTFSDGSAGLLVMSSGERLHIGEIDPRAISQTNELPKLTLKEAAARSWKTGCPDLADWAHWRNVLRR